MDSLEIKAFFVEIASKKFHRLAKEEKGSGASVSTSAIFKGVGSVV